MTKYLFILLPLIAFNAPSRLIGASESFYHAIHQVETGGRSGRILGDYNPKTKTYAALGPMQVHKSCFQDSGVKGKYEDCANLEFSKRVMEGYLKRYCPQAYKDKDYEILARVWNGGPKGYKNNNTKAYWARVQKYLK